MCACRRCCGRYVHVRERTTQNFSVMSFDFEPHARYLKVPGRFTSRRFPPFLYSAVRRNHGVMACEGSMFKSKFANALTR